MTPFDQSNTSFEFIVTLKPVGGLNMCVCVRVCGWFIKGLTDSCGITFKSAHQHHQVSTPATRLVSEPQPHFASFSFI